MATYTLVAAVAAVMVSALRTPAFEADLLLAGSCDSLRTSCYAVAF
jgi:hypothetical protein